MRLRYRVTFLQLGRKRSSVDKEQLEVAQLIADCCMTAISVAMESGTLFCTLQATHKRPLLSKEAKGRLTQHPPQSKETIALTRHA